MRNKIFAIFILAAVLLAVPVLAGGLAKSGQIDAQMGLRFTKALPDRMAAGQTAEAVVVDQAKLARFGIKAKNGDKLKLTVTQENKAFSIPSAGSQAHFIIGDSGVVSKAK